MSRSREAQKGAPVGRRRPGRVRPLRQGGKLHYVYNYVGSNFYHVEYHVESDVPVPEGRHTLRFEFEVSGKPDIARGKGTPGRAQLYIDGKLVGQGDVPLTMPLSLGLGGGIVCGADTGSSVCDEYEPPFEFTGTLHGVTVDVSGDLIKDGEAELRMHMARPVRRARRRSPPPPRFSPG